MSSKTSPGLKSGGKKLVQSRLPFKILSTSAKDVPTKLIENRKRKLSSSAVEDETPAPKIGRSDVKENIDKVSNIEPEVIDKDDTNDLVEDVVDEIILSDTSSSFLLTTLCECDYGLNTVPDAEENNKSTEVSNKISIKFSAKKKKDKKTKRKSTDSKKNVKDHNKLKDIDEIVDDVKLIEIDKNEGIVIVDVSVSDDENPAAEKRKEIKEADETIEKKESKLDDSIQLKDLKGNISDKDDSNLSTKIDKTDDQSESFNKAEKVATKEEPQTVSKSLEKKGRKSKEPTKVNKEKYAKNIKIANKLNESMDKIKATKDIHSNNVEKMDVDEIEVISSKLISEKDCFEKNSNIKEESQKQDDQKPEETEDLKNVDTKKVDSTLENEQPNMEINENSVKVVADDRNPKDSAEIEAHEISDEDESGKQSDSKPDELSKETRKKRASTAAVIPAVTPKRLKPEATNDVSASAEKKLTPKQIQKKQEAEKRNEERIKAKEEKDRKLQEEKDMRRKEKEEKDKQRLEEKEKKRKEFLEKEEQRKKERDEKEEQKRKEREQRDEEKRKKDEQKEEERKKKEEEENKKKRAAENFTKFFRNPKVDRRVSNDDVNIQQNLNVVGIGSTILPKVENTNHNFMPFEIKENMKLAPTTRRTLSNEEKKLFDDVFNTEHKHLYLKNLKESDYVIGKADRTINVNTEEEQEGDDDLMIIDDELGEVAATIEESKPKQKYRAKYFLFEENRRPPYYGTWRKKSTNIHPRRPLAVDKKFFDYEVDSDDEWEEEEPGESLHGSDDEKDKESDDDYEVDNEFFVPHGYLSEEENNEEDAIEEDNHPENQKAKLKILQQEFVAEMKKKTERIKPKLIGCIWMDLNDNKENTCPQVILNILEARSMLFNGPILLKPDNSNNSNLNSDENDKKEDAENKKQQITKDDIPDLIKLVHGNIHSRNFLITEYLAYRATQEIEGDVLTKVSIGKAIKELAIWKKCPTEGPMLNKLCWNVLPDILKSNNMEDVGLPNTWKYILQPTRVDTRESRTTKTSSEISSTPPSPTVTTPSTTVKSNKFNITKFAKVLTEEEKKKKFEVDNLQKIFFQKFLLKKFHPQQQHQYQDEVPSESR